MHITDQHEQVGLPETSSSPLRRLLVAKIEDGVEALFHLIQFLDHIRVVGI